MQRLLTVLSAMTASHIPIPFTGVLFDAVTVCRPLCVTTSDSTWTQPTRLLYQLLSPVQTTRRISTVVRGRATTDFVTVTEASYGALAVALLARGSFAFTALLEPPAFLKPLPVEVETPIRLLIAAAGQPSSCVTDSSLLGASGGAAASASIGTGIGAAEEACHSPPVPPELSLTIAALVCLPGPDAGAAAWALGSVKPLLARLSAGSNLRDLVALILLYRPRQTHARSWASRCALPRRSSFISLKGAGKWTMMASSRGQRSGCGGTRLWGLPSTRAMTATTTKLRMTSFASRGRQWKCALPAARSRSI